MHAHGDRTQIKLKNESSIQAKLNASISYYGTKSRNVTFIYLILR